MAVPSNITGLETSTGEQSRQGTTSAPILFVDLDGSLIATDLLWESTLAVIKRQPWRCISMIHWLTRGRAVLKQKLARLAQLDVTSLPYHQDVVEYVESEHDQGRTTILATASDSVHARGVADHLGIFDDILASDGQTNLKSHTKLLAIKDYCREHGTRDFAYLGDSRADLPIWREAGEAIVVAPSRRVRRATNQLDCPTRVLGSNPSATKSVLRAMRIHQWVKNVLLFVPLILAHKWGDAGRLGQASLAFLSFGFCASAVYVVNDLLDLAADRLHPQKRRRPFAAGDVPIALGPPLALMLLIMGLSTAALLLPVSFTAILISYLFVTTAYSMWLKRKVMADVLTLAGLYTLRIWAGGAATTIPVSEWLVAFAVFLFVSLAFVKRYAEIDRLARDGETKTSGRGYRTSDLSLIETMGLCSGYLAVLILALYINSDDVEKLYSQRQPLWLMCPLLMYWISRLWILAKRSELHEDPVVFAMTDRVSLAIGMIAMFLVAFTSLV